MNSIKKNIFHNLNPLRSQTNNNLYNSGSYFKKYPTLHIEDSEWKFTKLIHFLNKFNDQISTPEIRILDIGGGAGQILKKVSRYMETVHHKTVHKYALDISSKTLEMQRIVNPDLRDTFNEDICKTSLLRKKIDLALMIDVIEHVNNQKLALCEIKRISNYAILKVPLEYNLYSRLYNFIKRGEPRRCAVKNLGHINIYNVEKLINQIRTHTGEILLLKFTNVFSYYLNEKFYEEKISRMDRTMYFFADKIFKVSPKITSFLLTDFVILLVKCY